MFLNTEQIFFLGPQKPTQQLPKPFVKVEFQFKNNAKNIRKTPQNCVLCAFSEKTRLRPLSVCQAICYSGWLNLIYCSLCFYLSHLTTTLEQEGKMYFYT